MTDAPSAPDSAALMSALVELGEEAGADIDCGVAALGLVWGLGSLGVVALRCDRLRGNIKVAKC